ncbi:MAG: hypothetical protein ACK4UP_03965 [Spirosomataceae bacterium]
MKQLFSVLFVLTIYTSHGFYNQEPSPQIQVWRNLKIEMKEIFHPTIEQNKFPSLAQVTKFNELAKGLKGNTKKEKKDIQKLRNLSNDLLKATKKSSTETKNILVILHAHFAEIIPQDIKGNH